LENSTGHLLKPSRISAISKADRHQVSTAFHQSKQEISNFLGEKLCFHAKKILFHSKKLIFYAKKLASPRLNTSKQAAGRYKTMGGKL